MLAISLNPIDWVTSAGGAIAGAASDAVFDQATEWVEEGLAYIAGEVAGFLTDLGESNLGDETFQQIGGVFKYIALVTVLITMVLGASTSLLGGHKLSGVVQEVPITLVMLAGWYSVVTLWAEATSALTRFFLTDALNETFSNNMTLDPGMSSFFRLVLALVLMVFLVIFVVEMLVLSHMLSIAAVVGPLAIALRPWPSLKDVSGKMVRNLAALSLSPVLATASLSLAASTLNEDGQLSLTGALGACAGLTVSLLMPAMVARFLPIDGSGGLGGRGLVAAGVGAVGIGVAAVATGGAAAVAAPGATGATASGVSDE